MDSVLLHREVGRAKDLSTALRKRIMVCLCSIRVLINKIEVGPQNSEFECWLYQGFFYPRLLHISCSIEPNIGNTRTCDEARWFRDCPCAEWRCTVQAYVV
jgi:hypothetical protein